MKGVLHFMTSSSFVVIMTSSLAMITSFSFLLFYIPTTRGEMNAIAVVLSGGARCEVDNDATVEVELVTVTLVDEEELLRGEGEAAAAAAAAALWL